MPNSIRTPKQGNNATSRRIAEAVDNEAWQRFRLSLKGRSTADKLEMLRDYSDHWNDRVDVSDRQIDDVNIRVENYLKALARGGQIEPVRDGSYQIALLEDKIVIRK